MAQTATGIECIDNALGGGIQPQTITLIYGEPETGKSTLAMQCALHAAMQNRKVLYVDCDNTFSAKRLSQLAGDRFDAVAERIVLVKPRDFREQTAVVDHIEDYTVNVGLIVIDTFTSLYSAQAAAHAKAYSVNRELNRQLAILAQTVKTRRIPLILTSQVRSIMNEENESVRPVATRVLKFWADLIIALKPTEYPPAIKVTLEKAPQLVAQNICYIQIGEVGIRDTQFPKYG
ncbi:MAG: AAA family ATPase [Candidatus Bathyarchaeota archaeon]|nr:AAA family ATPase [Candidatus Bathyarchaeota archaeon]